MPDKIKIPELDIEVEDVDEFNDEASEYLTGFCEGLKDAGELVPVTENDYCPDETITHFWSDKAQKLIEDEISRLCTIGMKYFDELEIDISSHMYKEVE